MSAVLTVSANVRGESPLRLGAGTLPTLFDYVADGPDGADVVGVTGIDWVADASAAIEGGARGVLVVDPVAADVRPLREAASRHGAAVVLDLGWASSPSVAMAAPQFAPLAAQPAIVESRMHAVQGADLPFMLLRQVALLRAAVGSLDSLRLVRLDETGYDAIGELRGGADASLSAVLSNALREGAEVRIVRQKSTVSLELGPIEIASPGRIRVLTDAGENQLLAPYETPHREAWRRLHRAVLDGSGDDDLGAFADDAELVRAALEEAR